MTQISKELEETQKHLHLTDQAASTKTINKPSAGYDLVLLALLGGGTFLLGICAGLVAGRRTIKRKESSGDDKDEIIDGSNCPNNIVIDCEGYNECGKSMLGTGEDLNCEQSFDSGEESSASSMED